MKTIIFTLSMLLLILPNVSSHAAKESTASPAVSKALGGWEVMTSENAQLDKKTSELIAIAVAMNLRCDFCIQQHTEAARQLGATTAQIKHAFGIAGYMRMLTATLHSLPTVQLPRTVVGYARMLNTTVLLKPQGENE